MSVNTVLGRTSLELFECFDHKFPSKLVDVLETIVPKWYLYFDKVVSNTWKQLYGMQTDQLKAGLH